MHQSCVITAVVTVDASWSSSGAYRATVWVGSLHVSSRPARPPAPIFYSKSNNISPETTRVIIAPQLLHRSTKMESPSSVIVSVDGIPRIAVPSTVRRASPVQQLPKIRWPRIEIQMQMKMQAQNSVLRQGTIIVTPISPLNFPCALYTWVRRPDQPYRVDLDWCTPTVVSLKEQIHDGTGWDRMRRYI